MPIFPVLRASPVVGALALALALSLAATPRLEAAEGRWSALGGPPGTVYTIAIDSVNTTIVYVGTATAGVYKSSDGGDSWAKASAGLGSDTVFALVIDPQQPTTLYVGTNAGVYKSSDGAATWQEANSGLPTDPRGLSFVYALAIDPATPSTLYAGLRGGVYKSSDAGATWSAKNLGLRCGLRVINVWSLAIDPSDPQHLYVALDYNGQAPGVFQSIDGGESWTVTTAGLDAPDVKSLLLLPTTQTALAASESGGLYVSTLGADWVASNEGLGSLRASYLLADPQVAGAIYLGTKGGGVYRAPSVGASWVRRSEGLAHLDVLSLAAAGDALFAGTSGGLYRSRDGGVTWALLGGGFASAEVTDLALSDDWPPTLYAATRGGGVYRSSDGGSTWESASSGLPSDAFGRIYAFGIAAAEPGALFAIVALAANPASDGLYRSSDGGNTWAPVLTGTGGDILTLLALPGDPGTLFAGGDSGVYRSSDSGLTWNAANGGLPSFRRASLLTAGPAGATDLYAVAGEGLYHSRDQGESWQALSPPGGSLWALAAHPTRSGSLYLGTDVGLLHSADGGSSWETLWTGPAGEGVGAIWLSRESPATLMIVDTTGSIHRSVNGGRTWVDLGEGLAGIEVNTIVSHPSAEQFLYAATDGAGVWGYEVGARPSLSPALLALFSEPGSSEPLSSAVTLSDDAGLSYTWSLSGASDSPWLVVQPSVGSSLPATLSVVANVAGLASGHYSATITATAQLTGTASGSVGLEVRLFVGESERRYLPFVAKGASGW